VIELTFGQILPLDVLCCDPTMDVGRLHELLKHRAISELKICDKEFYDWFMTQKRKSGRTNLLKIDSYFRHSQTDMISNMIRIAANNSPHVVGSVLSGFVFGASKSDFVGVMNGRLLRELFHFRLGMTVEQWNASEWQGPFLDALDFFRIKSSTLIQIMREGLQLVLDGLVDNRFTSHVQAIIATADADLEWHTMAQITINEVIICGTCFFKGVEAPVGAGFDPFNSLESKQSWIDLGERFQMERTEIQDYPWQSPAYLIYFTPRMCLGTGMVIPSLSSPLTPLFFLPVHRSLWTACRVASGI